MALADDKLPEKDCKNGSEENPELEYGDMNDDDDDGPKATEGDEGSEKDGNEAVKDDGKEDKEDEPAVDETEDDYKHQPVFTCCCGTSFQFLGQITSHKKKACEWIYVCPHCDRVYKDFDKMEAHKKTHKKGIPTREILAEPFKKEAPPVQADKSEPGNTTEVVKADATKKPDVVALAKQEPKNIPKVERNVPKKTLIVRPPNIIRPNFPQGNNFQGNRPNFMPNQGMMNPGFQGGFNQGMNFGMGMMNPQMGMGNCGPMNMGMGMGNFGPNMCGPNMMGGMNMMNNFGPNMCGPNMMGGMNMGMNMNMANMGGNFGPNMGGNFGPMGGPMGMNQNMGGGRSVPGGGPNMGGAHKGGWAQGPKMPANPRPPLLETPKHGKRERELTPPGRRSPLRRSLSPLRRRDSRSPPLRRESPRDSRSRDGYSLSWREGSRERSRDRDGDPFRRDDDRPDRPDRPSPWAQRSMTREEFLSTSSSSAKQDIRDSSFPKDLREILGKADRRDDSFSRDYRDYSPRDDGPPGLGKYGFTGGSYKRENPDPLSKLPNKMLRPY